MEDAAGTDSPGAATFESSRRFQVWLYTVSHSQLLLRSTKTAEETTRIDLLFKGVDAVDLPTLTEGLTVCRSGRTYNLAGEGWTGAVEALALYIAEDSLEFYDPSPFSDSLPFRY